MVSFHSVLVVMLLLLSMDTVQPAKSDRERAELRGAVRSVSTRWQSNHKDDYGGIDERELGVVTYDLSGALLVDQQNTPDFIRTLTPERHGVLETVFRSRMGNYTERYEFDAMGNVASRRTWYSDSVNGDAAMFERTKYDTKGRRIERELLGSDGKRLDVTIYTRDATGDVVVEEDRPVVRKAPYPRMRYSYTRDSHGNWISRTVTRENVPETSYEYRYAGNLFRTITYFDR